MKKLFIYLSVAVLGIAAASCQKELAVAEGGKGNVTFTIQTPDAGTKAIADGTNVNVVYYEVYKAGSGHANSIVGGAPLIDRKIEHFTGTATLKLNLLQNQDYVVLFWAEVAGKSYYTTTDLRTVTVNYTGLKANDEARAAFCQKLEFNSSKTYSTKVTLVRPFAQINLGTTQNSIDPVVNGYNLDVESSYMKVVGAATTFSVASMTTGSETTTVEFAANTVPHDFTPDSEELKVNDVVYAYLGMNYILAANDVATVDVTYEINTNVGSISRQIPAVPVQTNYRTNLLGNLLTQETAIDIVVDERFAEPDLEPEAIYMAAANGGEFTLTEDVVLEAPVVVPANTNFVLNLNGKSIKNTTQSEEFGKGEAIIAYGNLTINGEGDVEGSTMAVWARGTDGAKVTINGGTYKGCAEGFAKGGRSVIYASSGNVIDIYGGTFESLSADKSSYANTTEGVYAALNVADNNGMINVYGGTFVKQNPAAPGTEPSAWNAAHPNGFVALGYTTKQDGDNYVVVAPTSVETTSDFKQALSEGKSVVLTEDIDYGTTQLEIKGENQVVNLGGHTLKTQMTHGGIAIKNGASIVNGTIEHTSTVAAIKAFKVGSIENVTIKTTCATTNKTITAIAVQQGGHVGSIKNVTIEGVSQGIEVGFQANVDLIENVTVEENTNGTANGIGLVINGGKVVKAKNCTFKGEVYGITMHLKGVCAAGLELENCKVEGTSASIYAWDEKGISNTSGSLYLTYDAATTLTGPFVWDFEDECQSVVTLNKPQ